MNINTMPPTSTTLQTNNISLSNSPRSTSLSNEQQSLIELTLGKYDSSKLSASDANEIVNTFSEAGIQPGKELENALMEAGFDAREIGSLAGSQKQGGTQTMPPPAENISSPDTNQNNLQILQAIFEKYQDINNLSNQDLTQLSQELQDAGLLEPGVLINTQS